MLGGWGGLKKPGACAQTFWTAKRQFTWRFLTKNIFSWGNIIIVELRTPAMPVGVGGGKERGGFHLNLRTWHAASCIFVVVVVVVASGPPSRSRSCSCCRCRCPCCRPCRRWPCCRRLGRRQRRRRRCCYCCYSCCCLVLWSLSLLSL